MWRVGSAERYPHHGPPSNAVVVNGASGELVSWDRAEETLRRHAGESTVGSFASLC